MQTEVDSSLLVLPSLTPFSLVNVALPVCSFIWQFLSRGSTDLEFSS